MGDTINQKVIGWARGKLRQQVGRGECWDLADQALRKAGALSSADLGSMAKDADYKWGDPIEIKDALPGDILQFRDFVLEQHVKPLGKKVQRHNLWTQDGISGPQTTYKHVRTRAGRWERAKTTGTTKINVSGTIWAYRPKQK